MGSLFNIQQIIYDRIIMIPAILIAFTFHEYAHALVADKLGDKTPRFQGRLSLNPITHIDPLGFIMVLLFRFGWAKPVQTNPSAFKNYHRDHLKVSLAGPIANFLISIVAMLVLVLYVRFLNGLPTALNTVLHQMIREVLELNVFLGIFNLLPVPPLDGFSLLRDLNPKTFYKYEGVFYQYQMIIMLVLIYVGGAIIQVPANIIINMLYRLGNMLLYIL
ncbi:MULTISPECIES: site-2 protease family protein [unclassified Clostridium]|uniref:site-2 protease family protein n=1 Tax=unclassified Clostridium TaxID=2614128 RepID=UPI00029799A4|nr:MULTISPECIES: site-2 protease family protein [unclassified Clostridium]EKQ53850.1 MAG: Zn-dependent protease [Clostridium sp. Maddingley MBC34-26]